MASRRDGARSQLAQAFPGARARACARQRSGKPHQACLSPTNSEPAARIRGDPIKEREVKLGAGPAFHLPDLNGVVDGIEVTPPEAVRLETVYYDTPDLRLARWGVSLRHRAGEGWTLKLPPKPGAGQPAGQMLERDELTFQGGSKKPPEAAVAPRGA